jgi:hypothetical protein
MPQALFSYRALRTVAVLLAGGLVGHFGLDYE